jgi:hypothetical protein
VSDARWPACYEVSKGALACGALPAGNEECAGAPRLDPASCGDGRGLMAVFGSAADAVRACLAAQRGLVEEPWKETGALRVRMWLYSGRTAGRAA